MSGSYWIASAVDLVKIVCKASPEEVETVSRCKLIS
jgi:hypothetical protein